MKRWLAVITIALMTTAFVACGGPAARQGNDGTTAPVTAAEPDTPAVRDVIAAIGASLEAGAATELQAPEQGPAAANVKSIDADAVVAAYERVLGDIYESVLPSVVSIQVARTTGPQRAGDGSGFVWSDEGHIVTNHHVVDGAGRITVVFADGSQFEAKLLGSDPAADLAVLKIDPAGAAFRPVDLGDSDRLRVGQLAVALGNPFGQEFTMTRGIVSALGRVVRAGSSSYSNPEIIQTDAPINPGNSGGPLLDRHGRVIGINAQMLSRSGSSAGVGFAVPVNTARRVVPELMASGRYVYSYLGISAASLNPELARANSLPTGTRGALLIDVTEGSPADQAGLVASDGKRDLDGLQYPIGGDVITAINGTPVDGLDDLVSYLVSETRPGDGVSLDLLTGGEERTGIEVILGSRPTSATG